MLTWVLLLNPNTNQQKRNTNLVGFPFFLKFPVFRRGKIKQTFRKEQKERGRALRCLLQTVGDTSLSIWLRAQCS